MLKIFSLLCLIYQLNPLFAALARLPYVPTPPEYEYLEGCYVPEIDWVVPYDEPYSPADGTSCIEYTCQTDNVTIIETCGAIYAGGGCKKYKGNLWLPYPYCCDTVKCLKNETYEAVS